MTHAPPARWGSRLALAVPLLVGAAGCGEPARHLADTVPAESTAAQIEPAVERAVGLDFKRSPHIAIRSRQQVRTYLEHKLDTDLPPAQMEGVTLAYRLFGLIPDTLNLRALLLSLYTEQVVGYYDPDSTTLYVVAGTDPAAVRLVMAHELVHALQGQYVNLDSLLDQPHENDRRMAAQAVMEGQAMLASLVALMPEQDFDTMPDFWGEFRRSVRAQQAKMPVFHAAPAIVREDLIFPYLAGADFVRWFRRTYPDTVPFGRRLPQSTAQILFPERYRAGQEPVTLAFRGRQDPVYQDDLGAFETRVLLTQLTGSEATASSTARGWAGDRYGVFKAGTEYALVWYSAWDSDQAAEGFAGLLQRGWPKHAGGDAGRRSEVSRQVLGGHPVVLVVDAPAAWLGWQAVPGVAVR
jgi:Zn-dependent peptidase ImmA (M78 family)